MFQISNICNKSFFGSVLAISICIPLHNAHGQSGFRVLYTFNGGTSDGDAPESALILKGGSLYGTTVSGGFGPAGGDGVVFKLALDGTESVLYFFNDKTGREPVAPVIADKQGNLYGTTKAGGPVKHGGAGVVFMLAPDGSEKTLYSFPLGGSDGGAPEAGLIRIAGNLYGTASGGGVCDDGVVFKVAKDGKETLLHSFCYNDGSGPVSGLIADKAGTLYGTTNGGGARGDGVIFKLAKDGTETVLYSFKGGKDGAFPQGGLLADDAGNLYGTTTEGGGGIACYPHGCGTVFKLDANGVETVLHSFKRKGDGIYPWATTLIADAAGSLYGTTEEGGRYTYGTVFKVAPDGKEKVLHSFTGNPDGAYPLAGLVADSAGNLYGTTQWGTVFTLKE